MRKRVVCSEHCASSQHTTSYTSHMPPARNSCIDSQIDCGQFTCRFWILGVLGASYKFNGRHSSELRLISVRVWVGDSSWHHIFIIGGIIVGSIMHPVKSQRGSWTWNKRHINVIYLPYNTVNCISICIIFITYAYICRHLLGFFSE